MEQPYLALASGHTKSAAILVDCAKGILGAVEGAPFNPHSLKSEELSTQNLTLLVNELERVTGSSDLVNTSTRICLVAAGGAFEDDQTRVIDLLAHLPGCDLDPARVIVADDTWVGLLAGTLTYEGTCAFSGTGASVYVGDGQCPKGNLRKIDGWGPIIGDFGGGFQLAVDMFRRLGRWRDMYDSAPLLFDEVSSLNTRLREKKQIIAQSSLESLDHVQEWFDSMLQNDHTDWRISLAKFAAAATKLAEPPTSDSLSAKLVKKAAFDMATSVNIARNKWGGTDQLVLQGGMFDNSPTYTRYFTSLLSKYYEKIEIAQYRPIFGAGLIAVSGLGNMPEKNIIQIFKDSCESLDQDQQKIVKRTR